jgi:alkanesulfonate monooxygenase SsuD/methylene tetrahydromethanopterin reductase-like flavin-dependent oxidoreductase (luciferase family)
VARWGDSWIPVLPSPKQLKEGIASIKREMIESKKDPEKLQVAYGGSGCLIIGEDQDEVKEMSEPLFRSENRLSNISNCIIGTPDQCIAKIEEYRRAGANTIVAGFYDFPSVKGLRLFAEKVIPRFKSLPSFAT